MHATRNLLVHVMLALGAATMLWFALAGAVSGLLQSSDGTTPDTAFDVPSLLVGFASGAVAGALTVGLPAAAKLRTAARKGREKLGGDCDDTGLHASKSIKDSRKSDRKEARQEATADRKETPKGWDGTVKGVTKDAADLARAGPIEDPRFPPPSLPPQQRKILDYGEAGEAIDTSAGVITRTKGPGGKKGVMEVSQGDVEIVAPPGHVAASDRIVPVAMDKGLGVSPPQDDALVKAEGSSGKREFKGHVTLMK